MYSSRICERSIGTFQVAREYSSDREPGENERIWSAHCSNADRPEKSWCRREEEIFARGV